jgi:uncharacterized protein YcfL
MSIRKHFALAPALCGLVLACTAIPGSQNSYRGESGSLQMQRIEGNELLARDLSILNPRSKLEDGRRVIQFELKNNRTSQLRFAWAVDWYDRSGFRVSDTTRHWEPIALGGGGSTTLTIRGPSPEADGWNLQVTSPDEVQ